MEPPCCYARCRKQQSCNLLNLGVCCTQTCLDLNVAVSRELQPHRGLCLGAVLSEFMRDQAQLLSHLVSTVSMGSQEPSPLEKVDHEQCQSPARLCSHSLNEEGQRFKANPWASLRRDGHFSSLCPYWFSPGSPAPSQGPKTCALG